MRLPFRRRFRVPTIIFFWWGKRESSNDAKELGYMQYIVFSSCYCSQREQRARRRGKARRRRSGRRGTKATSTANVNHQNPNSERRRQNCC